MSEEELIETLKEFEKNRVEQLKEPSRNLFYAIMKIADERDKYKIVLDKIKEILNKMIYEGYAPSSTGSITLYTATGENSEFGTRAKVILELLEEIE